RVGAPFRGPTHLLDFFFNRRRDGAVANVGVDFYQEIAADDHRLGFRVIDVRRDDGPPARDFVAHIFWCYPIRDVRAETFTGMLLAKIISVLCLLSSVISQSV